MTDINYAKKYKSFLETEIIQYLASLPCTEKLEGLEAAKLTILQKALKETEEFINSFEGMKSENVEKD